ncbi:MAG: amino acid ABC transporter permease [Clostridia bacterium]|nr:amino acid ABC transporter permease [Clostridia bacterium]
MFDWLAAGWANFCEGFYNNLIHADRWKLLLEGLGVTLEITCAAIVMGTILGVILAFMKMSKIKLFRGIAKTYIEIIRGTPTTVQLLIMYMGVFASVSAPKWIVASIAFGMNSAAYVAEIVRAGVESVDHGQIEAGRSLGLSNLQTTMKIVLPQAIKIALPTYTSEFIVLLKETSIAGYIAMEDLTKVASMITSRTFNAWFPLLTAALLYFLMTFTLAKIFGCLERRLRKSDLR